MITPQQFEGVRPHSEGLAAVKVDGKWGYIDTKGTMVIKPQFLRVYKFENGTARVNYSDQYYNRAFWINKKGERLPRAKLPPGYKE